MVGQGRCCRKLLEDHYEAETERRRNGTKERFGVIGCLGCDTKELRPPACRGLDRMIRKTQASDYGVTCFWLHTEVRMTNTLEVYVLSQNVSVKVCFEGYLAKGSSYRMR